VTNVVTGGLICFRRERVAVFAERFERLRCCPPM